MFANTQRAVRVDPPRELDPELVLFPHLSDTGRFVRLVGRVEFLAFFSNATRKIGWRKPIQRAA